jgi:putative ABC transport system permease protein
MVMAIRERTREIAVMKTIGFSPAQIFRMIISETILLAVVGGTLGLGVGLWLLQVVSKLGFIALPLGDSWIVAVEGAALMVALGLVTGFLPAYNAMRLNIVTGLGRN